MILEGTAVPRAEPAAAARVPVSAADRVARRMDLGIRRDPGALALARAEASLAVTDGATLPAALAPPLSGKEAQSEASLALHGGVNPVLMTDPSPNLLLPASASIEDLEVEGEAELAEMLGSRRRRSRRSARRRRRSWAWGSASRRSRERVRRTRQN